MHKNGFVRILAFCPIVNASVRQYGPLGRSLPSLSGFRPTLKAKFSAQSGYFDHNTENVRSDFRHSQKSIHCARRNFDFYSFAENEDRRATVTPKSDTHSDTHGVGRNALQRPPTASIAEWVRASSAACVPSAARTSSTESGHEKAPLLGLSQSVVRAKGLEPSRGCPHMDLNHTRLPIPPRPRGFQ